MVRLTASELGRDTRLDASRLTNAARRDALLDTAAELVAEGDVDAVSMEAVAERAGVSRPLVYKHFANRSELLTALYTRESGLLHRELVADVEAAGSLEDKFRALIRGLLRVQGTRRATFALLRAAGVRNDEHAARQRRRDRNTVFYFAEQAGREFALPAEHCRAAVAVALSATDAVLRQWRLKPTAEYAAVLEDVYVGLAVGGLNHLSSQHRLAAKGNGRRR